MTRDARRFHACFTDVGRMLDGCWTDVGRMLDVGSTVGAGRKINGSWFLDEPSGKAERIGTWRDGREIVYWMQKNGIILADIEENA